MSKHTEGPWTIKPFRNLDKDIWINEPNVRVDHDDIDLEESEANAHLIAAAPEMYDALLRIKHEHGWMWLNPILDKAAPKKGK